MHKIKELILKKLILNDFQNYSQLKPKNIESNLFSYHLIKLLDEKIITKKNKRYTLTSKGKNLSQKISFKGIFYREQPLITTLIVLENLDNELLLFKKGGNPLSEHGVFLLENYMKMKKS